MKQENKLSSSASEQIPLLFFSGMGADESIFLPQRIVFPSLTVVPWQVPAEEEDLSSYCARLAEKLDPGCPCIVGGASFGGIVAQELSHHLPSLGVVLIGSVRSAAEIPKRIRVFQPIVRLLKFLPVRSLQELVKLAIPALKALRAKHLAGLALQFSAADPKVIRWSMKQLLLWNAKESSKPIRQIHGAKDFVFPVANLQPDETVENGGHVISLTHSRQVNAFIHGSLAILQSQPEA